MSDEKPIRDLISDLVGEDEDRSFEAQVGLIAYRRAAVEFVLPLVSHPNMRVRYRVAMILGRSRDPQALEPLLRLTADPAGPVRYDATVALGLLGDGRAVRRLVMLAEAGPRDDGVEAAAAAALNRLGLRSIPED